MAALLVLERQQGIALLGSSVGVFLLLNLAITFVIPGLGRGHMAYGRLAPAIVAGIVAVVAGGFAVAVLVA